MTDDERLFVVLHGQMPRMTMREIGAYIGISAVTACKWARRLGLKRAAPERYMIDKNEFERLFKAGLSYKDIGARLGVGAGTVLDRVKKWGLVRHVGMSNRKTRKVTPLFMCPVCGGPSPTRLHTVCEERQRDSKAS